MAQPNLNQVLFAPDNNFVEYWLYPEDLTLTPEESEGERLEELGMTMNAAALLLAKDYLWQKEAFALKPDLTTHSLHGYTQYGDTVEDEWFVVNLLRQLSIQFPTVVVRY